MIFTNPEIIRNSNDIKIGGINLQQSEISYLGYIQAVRIRLIKLVNDFIKSDMSEGASHQDSIKDCLALIHSTLNYPIGEEEYPQNESGIADEIMKSEEFRNWQTDIRYRFLEDSDVRGVSWPIKISSNINQNVSQESIELVTSEDTLQVALDGLAATNYID
jgi:hypothetical protein